LVPRGIGGGGCLDECGWGVRNAERKREREVSTI